MLRTLVSALRPLRRNERGVSVVEFGMLAPFLGLLVAGMIDLGQGLSERFTIQQAVNRGLEMLHSATPEADAEESAVDYSFVRTEAAAAAGVPVDQVTMNQWLECDGTRQTDFNGSCDEGEEMARYIELRIVKDYTGSLFLGEVEMGARGAVRIQ
jgi:Flp pilus assembly protein TadG